MSEGDGCDFSQHLPMLVVMQGSFWLLGGAKKSTEPLDHGTVA